MSYIQKFTNPRFPFEKSEAERLAESLRSDATVVDGVIHWNSNGRVIPADCAEFAAFLDLPVDLAACTIERDRETAAALDLYRDVQSVNEPTAEEMFEMRAAFGEGVTVVDVLSGRKVSL